MKVPIGSAFGQITQLDLISARQDDGPLDNISQFSEVAGQAY
jgi:hypothetical protein